MEMYNVNFASLQYIVIALILTDNTLEKKIQEREVQPRGRIFLEEDHNFLSG